MTANYVMGPARRRNPPSRIFRAFAVDPASGSSVFVGEDPSLSTVRVRAKIVAQQWRTPVVVVDEHGKQIKTFDPTRPRTMNMTRGSRLKKNEVYAVKRASGGESYYFHTKADARLMARRFSQRDGAKYTVRKERMPGAVR